MRAGIREQLIAGFKISLPNDFAMVLGVADDEKADCPSRHGMSYDIAESHALLFGQIREQILTCSPHRFELINET